MGPKTALRKLEELVRGSELPEVLALLAEECLSVLWRKELLGKDE